MNEAEAAAEFARLPEIVQDYLTLRHDLCMRIRMMTLNFHTTTDTARDQMHYTWNDLVWNNERMEELYRELQLKYEGIVLYHGARVREKVDIMHQKVIKEVEMARKNYDMVARDMKTGVDATTLFDWDDETVPIESELAARLFRNLDL